MIDAPKKHILDVQFDFRENTTLLVGPEEEQEWRFATARQGHTPLGFYGAFLSFEEVLVQRHIYFHFVSDILDHTALFVALALKHVLANLGADIKQFKGLHCWSDSGPHFRS